MEKLTNLSNYLSKFIIILSVTILMLLSILSCYKKAVFNLSYYEEVHFEYHSWLFVIGIVIALLIIILLTKYVLIKINPLLLFIICTLFYTIAFIIIVNNIPLIIRADQESVFNTAINFTNGDYSSFFNGYYIYVYPHQLGLLTFERLIIILFGTNLKTIFSLYFVMIIGINFFQWKISKLLFANKTIENLTILFSFLFLPQLFITLFVYGQTPGLLFLLIGIYLIIRSQYSTNSKIIHSLLVIVGIISICTAIYIRKNFIIILIALIIIFFLKFITKKQKRYGVYVLLLIVTNLTINTLSDNYYAKKVGVDKLNSGMPSTLWISMGLQENELFPSLNGWWSGYNNKVYSENNYDHIQSNKVATNDIKNRLNYFKENPYYTVKFFKHKMETTWLDPYFQAIWAGPIKLFKDDDNNSKLLKNIYEGGIINDYIGKILNIHLTLIYILSSIGLIIYRVKEDFKLMSLYSALFFIGTLIFHLIWETKALYVYPAVYMLIPFSAYSLFKITNFKRNLNNEGMTH